MNRIEGILICIFCLMFGLLTNELFFSNQIVKNKYENAVNEYEKLVHKHNELFKKYRNLAKLENITITAYSICTSETDNTPNKTAIMEIPVSGYTCAVSRNLSYLLGNKIYINGIGVFKVNDLMNKRYNKRIDICMGKKEAIQFGKKRKEVILIGK